MATSVAEDLAPIFLDRLLAHRSEVLQNSGRSEIDSALITYKVLCQRCGCPGMTHSVGAILGLVAQLCCDRGWPPITALVVNAQTRIPGENYDKAPGCDASTWEQDVMKVMSFNGYPEPANRV